MNTIYLVLIRKSDNFSIQHELNISINEMESVYGAVRTESLNMIRNDFSFCRVQAVPGVRMLVAGLSPRKPGFDPRLDRVRVVVTE
jgi:hypothetical protein